MKNVRTNKHILCQVYWYREKVRTARNHREIGHFNKSGFKVPQLLQHKPS